MTFKKRRCLTCQRSTASPEILNMNDNQNPMLAYDKIVGFVADRLDTFKTDDVRLLAEAKGLPLPDNPAQWGNVLRSSHSRGLCKPIDKFEKSRYRGTSAAPRMLWIKPGKRGGQQA